MIDHTLYLGMKTIYEEVYKLVKLIPKGKVTTYGAIARKLSMSPRAVGYTLHLNPDGAKTPCHRVVNRVGRIAPGFAFGGQGVQKMRLEQEGIEFIDENHLDLKRYSYELSLHSWSCRRRG